MKHIKEFKLNEDYSNKRLTFEELLDNSDFQDIYDNMMDQDGFGMFEDLYGTDDSLTYEVNGRVILIYTKNFTEDLISAVKSLGADDAIIQDDHIRCWFD